MWSYNDILTVDQARNHARLVTLKSGTRFPDDILGLDCGKAWLCSGRLHEFREDLLHLKNISFQNNDRKLGICCTVSRAAPSNSFIIKLGIGTAIDFAINPIAKIKNASITHEAYENFRQPRRLLQIFGADRSCRNRRDFFHYWEGMQVSGNTLLQMLVAYGLLNNHVAQNARNMQKGKNESENIGFDKDFVIQDYEIPSGWEQF